VPGVRYVQAALTGAGWIVEYRTSNRHFRLDQEVLDDENALDYISQVLGQYSAGDDEEFFDHRWEDVSAELIV